MITSNARQYYKSYRAEQELLEKKREEERLAELERIKKEQAKAKAIRRDRQRITACVLFCFLLAFSFTFLEAKIVDCGYAINSAKEEISDIQDQSDRLRLEIEDLCSLARIEEYAINNLGMVYPDATDIAYVQFTPIESLTVAESTAEEEPVASVVVHEEEGQSGFLQSLYALVSGHFFEGAKAAENE